MEHFSRSRPRQGLRRASQIQGLAAFTTNSDFGPREGYRGSDTWPSNGDAARINALGVADVEPFLQYVTVKIA